MRNMGVIAVLMALAIGRAAASPDPLDALARCAAHAGTPACPERYLTIAPQCLRGAGGPCLIALARKAAASDDCTHALRLARLCLCDHPEDASALDGASTCAWLRGAE